MEDAYLEDNFPLSATKSGRSKGTDSWDAEHFDSVNAHKQSCVSFCAYSLLLRIFFVYIHAFLIFYI